MTNAGTSRPPPTPESWRRSGSSGLESLVNGSLSGGPGLISLSTASRRLSRHQRRGLFNVWKRRFIRGTRQLHPRGRCVPRGWFGRGFRHASDQRRRVGPYDRARAQHQSDALAKFLGIPVVKVTGATSESRLRPGSAVDCRLLHLGPVSRYEPRELDQHELVTVGFGPGAFEMPMAVTAAQDIWHQSSATVWLDRQADLRICLALKRRRESGGPRQCNRLRM